MKLKIHGADICMSESAKVRISNSDIAMEIDKGNGLICGLYSPIGDFNLADKNGFGGVRYTLKGDDIKTDLAFTAYIDRLADYDKYELSDGSVSCENTNLGIHTDFSLEDDELKIEAYSQNENISQFGIDLNFNFLGKKNGTYIGQLIPSSPYTSMSEERLYCILPIVGVGFCAVVSLTQGSLWKIDYSPYCAGHYINGFQIMSSTDSIFGREGEKQLSLRLVFAKTVEECYTKIQSLFDAPMIIPSVTGTFSDKLSVDIIGDADTVKAVLGDREQTVAVKDRRAEITALGYGRHTLIPYFNGAPGLDTQVWFGGNVKELFEKSCDTVREPYHGDDNLCEGMTWCWAMLSYMNLYGSTKYLETVKKALRTVMCDGVEPLERQSIVPYPVDGLPPYHIYKSKRVQEQFFGISMLTEMYKLTKDKKYLNFAANSAKTMIKLYQREDGAIVPETDYTTVCAPIIPIIDLALIYKDMDKSEYNYFASSAKKIAEYLIKRGLHFPTEGEISDINDEEMEEGSISCTALSILYYCRYIERRQDYIDFAEKVLKLHDYWITYTPDVRLYRSTMRWWENIWEGDGTGPSICAGHAWTIWRAEADYHMAVLTGKEEYFKKSLNGFMTNFSKITAQGESYACYQPDYFAGGGHEPTRKTRKQLSEADYPKRYVITHDYPKHYDHSLSRYVWARASATWLRLTRDELVTPDI